MAEKMVRCFRCHEVFDAEAGPCTKCGTPYRPPVAQPRAGEGLYVEKYAGTPFAPVPDPVPLPPRQRSTSPVLLIAGGIGLMAVALVVAFAAALGGLGSQPTSPPQLVIAQPAQPTPTPTLPPSVALTLAQLSDRNLCADVTVQSRVDVNSRVLGKSETRINTFQGQLAGGDQSGIATQSGATAEFRLVGGAVYVRVPPATKWMTAASMPSYLIIEPLFGITKPEMIQLVGSETREGQPVNHFRTTKWWGPDIARMAMMDISGLGISPDASVLDIWTTPAGSPITAKFSATNAATDGTRLLDIEATYTFANVGIPRQIQVPLPSTNPSPKASPSK
jgi:hypothetical protein